MSSLSTTAIRVVKASAALDSIDKLVWTEIYHLDRGTEGCYMRPDTLARRVGRSRKTMERSRRRLKEWGLVRSVHRRGYCDSWYVNLPVDCVLLSNRPSDEEVFAAAARLDKELAQPGTTDVTKLIANLGSQMQPGSPKPDTNHEPNLVPPTSQPGVTDGTDKEVQNSTEVSTEGQNEKKNETTKERKRSPPDWIAQAKRIARERESTIAGKPVREPTYGG